MKFFRTILGTATVVALLAFSSDVFAQENGNRDENGQIVRGAYVTNTWDSNWFVGAGAGINSFYGKGMDAKAGIAVDAFVGKWFTPCIGARLGWKGLNDKIEAKSGYTTPSEKFNLNEVKADFLWNVSNAFSGYKETRIWDVILYPSVAYVHAKKNGLSNKEYGVGAGMINDFRLCKHLDLYVDLSVLATKNDLFGVKPNDKRVGVLPSATVGLLVNLGNESKRGFNRLSSVMPVVVPVPFTTDQYNALQDKVVALEKENADLKDKIQELQARGPEKVFVESKVITPATLYFEIGQTKLSDRELAHLDYYAENVLAGTDQKITITGSSDKETGSAKRNQYLSEKRAEFVHNLLVSKYGISEDQIISKGEGATNNIFNTPALNRVVIIK